MTKYFCRLVTPQENLECWVEASEIFNAAVNFVASKRDKLKTNNEYDLGIVGSNGHNMVYVVKQKRNHASIQPDLFCNKEKFDEVINSTLQASESTSTGS